MIDTDIFHRHGREEDGASAFGIDFIYLLELSGGIVRLLLLALYWLETECVRHLYKPPVFHYPNGWLIFGDTPFLVYLKNIHTSHSV